MYKYITSPGHLATQSHCSFLTQSLHLYFTSTITTRGQDKHCVHGLTAPTAPLKTHTINNNMGGHNYVLLYYSFADYDLPKSDKLSIIPQKNEK